MNVVLCCVGTKFSLDCVVGLSSLGSGLSCDSLLRNSRLVLCFRCLLGPHACSVHRIFLAVVGREMPTVESANGPSSNTTQDPVLWELDTFKFPIANGNNIPFSSRRVNRKWNSREERKHDMEYDVVLVPHDGGCISGSESDDSDWSVGWLEPHGPEFRSDDDDESNNSFAVLVPCYGRGVHNVTDIPQNNLFDPTRNFSDGFPAETKKYMEQWLSSLRNNY